MYSALLPMLVLTLAASPGARADEIDVIRQRLTRLYTGQTVAGDGAGHTAAIGRLDAQVTELIEQPPAPPTPGGGGRIDLQMAHWYQVILPMAQAYASPRSSLHRSAPLKAAIEARLGGGLPLIAPDAERPGDWYPWEIGIPRSLGPTLLLLEAKIEAKLFADSLAALEALQSPRLSLNGSNLAQEARNQLYVALLKRDTARLDHIHDFLTLEATVHNDSGILEDYSYQFHGRLPHTSGYGSQHARSMAEAMYLTEGTRWQFDDQRKALMARHLIEHARWVIVGDTYDLSVHGRGVRYNPRATEHVNAMCLLAAIDSPLREPLTGATAEVLGRTEWRPPLLIAGWADQLAAIPAKPLTGFRHFYVSDYAVFRRPTFYASVRMYSTRLIDYEGNWGANMSGWNLSHGLTYISRDGNEYWRDRATIREHMDWDRLPGTTSRVGVHPPEAYNVGTSPFAGGAGSERAGVCGFVLVPTAGDFVANKSYHFFDGGFVALGSGIRSTAERAEPINTTIAQWACPTAETPVVISGGRKVTSLAGPTRWEGVRWAFCDGVGYVFYRPVTLHGHRRGKLVTLWLDHGADVRDGRYAYVVLPATTLEQTQRFAANPTMRVVAHTPTVHACHDTTTGALGAMFWKPGGIARLEVDRPAAVYVEPQATGHLLALQNPLHDSAPIGVKIAPVAAGDALELSVATEAGRVVRMGLGGGQVTQQPRADSLPYETFDVQATRDGADVVLTARIPKPARSGYRFILRGSKGHYYHEFTDADIIDRPSAGVVRYRWRPDPTRRWRGDYRAILHSGMHLVVDYFSVADPPQ